MAEGWLFDYLRPLQGYEDGQIYPEDVVALAGWANSCAVLLRALSTGTKTSDPNMLKDVLDTGVRIGILPPSHVREIP